MEDFTRDERAVLEEKYGGIVTLAFEEDRYRLAKGEPVAYVIGHQPFLGLAIRLDSHPLIPRPETEYWTELLLSKFRTRRVLNFLDLCAGSGAIGCAALKYLPRVEIWFAELDPAHEPTIRANLRGNDLDASRAHICIGDLFAPLPPTVRFDVIAANPPYVPENRALPPSVGYEPARALYAGTDGLALIRRIARELPARLARPHGIAWIECDSAHVEEARALFARAGMRAEIMHDQYGRPRVLMAYRAPNA